MTHATGGDGALRMPSSRKVDSQVLQPRESSDGQRDGARERVALQ